ncbi:hypothetical protein X777_05180 [Ooceraea biroi]|uniref:Uncharacterized protein n=1 Tax=Ooceraea biroi TaxID=2015173 RepID=A0A026WGT4_OOCBI|nr:hypothetical protein X777_05180 [Ooceraea biroi]
MTAETKLDSLRVTTMLEWTFYRALFDVTKPQFSLSLLLATSCQSKSTNKVERSSEWRNGYSLGEYRAYSFLNNVRRVQCI